MLSLLVAAVSIGAGQPPSPDDIAKVILANVQRIQSIQIDIDAKFRKQERSDVRVGDWNYRIWLEGERNRTEYFAPQPNETEIKRTISCLHCEKKNAGFFYTDMRADPDDQNSPRLAASLSTYPPEKQTHSVLVTIKPWLIAFVPRSPMNQRYYPSISEVLASADRHGERVEAIEYLGKPCYRVSFSTKVRDIVYIVDQKAPYRCYYIQRTEPPGGDPEKSPQVSQSSTTSRYENAELAAYGIPSHYEYRGREGHFRDEEIGEVKRFSINKPIPASAFKVTGMDLPAGVSIVGDVLGDTYRWDGKSLVPDVGTPELQQRVVQAQATQERQKTTDWLLGASLFVLGVVFMLVVYRLRRKRG